MMTQPTSPIEIYQFRLVLRETSPHIWRRILVASDTTLIAFHQVIQIAFGWSGRRCFSFHIQGYRQQAASISDPRQVTLSDVRLYPKERFRYDEENTDAMSRPWSFQARLENKLPVVRGGEKHYRYRRFRALPVKPGAVAVGGDAVGTLRPSTGFLALMLSSMDNCQSANFS
jgi:hypothetical protein